MLKILNFGSALSKIKYIDFESVIYNLDEKFFKLSHKKSRRTQLIFTNFITITSIVLFLFAYNYTNNVAEETTLSFLENR